MEINPKKIKELIVKNSSIGNTLCLIVIFLGIIIYGLLTLIIPQEVINSTNGKSIILIIIYGTLSTIAIFIHFKRLSNAKIFAEKNYNKTTYSKGKCKEVVMEVYGKEPFIRYKYFVKFCDENNNNHKSEILESEKATFEQLKNEYIDIAIIPKYKEGYFYYAFLEKKEP